MHIKLFKNNYLKNMMTLISGSMIAQIITIIVSPISTRLFTSEDLGIYTLITSTVTMFGSVLSLRYDMSIVSEKNENNVYALTLLSTIICLIFSMVISIGYTIYFLLSDPIDISVVLIFIFIFLLNVLNGLINIIMSYNNRYKQYGLMTSMYLIRTLIQNAGIVIFGLIKAGVIGLVLSQIIGYFFGLKKQSQDLLCNIDKILNVKKEDLIGVAKKHKRQMLLSAPATFANGFSYSVINFFIQYLYSSSILGYYSISYRILGLPISIISANVSKVFFERATKEYNNYGNFKKSYIFTLLILIAISLPIGMLLIICSPTVCSIFFGNSYVVSGIYIRILTPMYLLRFITGGLNCSAIIANKQHYDLIIQIVLTIISILSFIIAIVFNLEIYLFLTIINFFFSIVYIFYLLLFWKASCG